jgi:hypothetical protein
VSGGRKTVSQGTEARRKIAASDGRSLKNTLQNAYLHAVHKSATCAELPELYFSANKSQEQDSCLRFLPRFS